ncbi:MAG TPA: peptidoglycan DD-metalloendopeptidase family protein [Rhodanobacteraceae bacterium]|nr:peptidoglycan DD-metalloendopeptidase family protein [Rhodanobacteraceae bacterium]
MQLQASAPRRILPATALCALIVFASAAHGFTPPAPSTPATASSSDRQAATRTQLAAVRAKIARITAAQHATAAKRGAINAKLAGQAAQLGKAANALRGTQAAIAAKTAALADLEQQRTQLEQKLSDQRAALAGLLRAVYTLDRGSDLALLLGDVDVAKVNRALVYSHYFQHDRIARIRKLSGEAAQLEQVKASIETEAVALQRQRDQGVAQTKQLEQARDAQRALLAEANRQLVQQKDKLAALRQDADALNQLLQRLRDVFADIPAHLGDTPFAKLRGKLAWPVTGAPHEGTGTLANGIVIITKPGAEVRAVAYGRVAWASFMRGYGMLVIIDQGGGWMSLYGGNEATLVSVGDWVRPGQPIATVGRDPEQGGAWFGLRKGGKPIDPQGWFASHR